MIRPVIEVEGLPDLLRTLRKVGDSGLRDAVKDANRQVARQVVDKALPNVPVRSGKLKRSVRALATQRDARVKAGGGPVPYGPAVHWGTGPRRGKRGPHNIEGRPFLYDAAQEVRQGREAERAYREALERVIKAAGLH